MEPSHPQPSCLPGSHHFKYSPWSLPAQFNTFFFWSFHSNPSLQLFLLFCYLMVIFLCVGHPLDNELSEKKNPFIFFISSMHTNTYRWSMNVSGINGWKKMDLLWFFFQCLELSEFNKCHLVNNKVTSFKKGIMLTLFSKLLQATVWQKTQYNILCAKLKFM